MKNYYDILGVTDSASDQQIKDAYRRLAKRYHPDVNAGAKGAEEKFKEIAEAYDTLSDPILKSNYDRKRTKQFYYSFNFANVQESEIDKRDPKKKMYTDEEFAYARQRHQARIHAQMRRRKKILVGMIVTFVVFLFAAAKFESYIGKKREEQAEAMRRALQSNDRVADSITPVKPITDLDSPYDSIYGKGIYVQMSPNEIVVHNPLSDAIVCVVEAQPPYRTIRNEYITAKHDFKFAELPNGSFHIKIQTGEEWERNKITSNGMKLGGFKKDTEYYILNNTVFSLQKPTYQNKNTNTSDTVIIDPTAMKFTSIDAAGFFYAGQR